MSMGSIFSRYVSLISMSGISKVDLSMLMFAQLHDFGPEWSKEMRKCWVQWHEQDYWYMRSTAKGGRHLPVGFALKVSPRHFHFAFVLTVH